MPTIISLNISCHRRNEIIALQMNNKRQRRNPRASCRACGFCSNVRARLYYELDKQVVEKTFLLESFEVCVGARGSSACIYNEAGADQFSTAQQCPDGPRRPSFVIRRGRRALGPANFRRRGRLPRAGGELCQRTDGTKMSRCHRFN